MKCCQEYIQAVCRHIQQVDCQIVFNRPSSALLIDVREADEVSQGKIAGAIHIPRGTLEMDIARLIPAGQDETFLKGRDILLYCRSGKRSALAAESLGRMGLPRVFSMAGGYQAWTASGLPVE